ncbi:MAG: two-component regulator propeller domain-containing protein [Flavobacteriales bacterium]
MLYKLLAPVVLLCLHGIPAWAQNPPVTVEWQVTLPYGSQDDWPPRISVDQGITFWMLSDDFDQYSISDGVIRRYDANGLSLTGTYPEATTIGCGGSLDHPVDLFVRNDSIWGIAYWQTLGGAPQDILYCAQGPSSVWVPDANANGAELHDGIHSMLVYADRRYLCAWHEPSTGQRDGLIVALDHLENVLWTTELPSNSYGTVQSAAELGDSIAVAGFPDLYWLRRSDGMHSSTTQLYTGAQGSGVVLRNGTDLYWAATEAGTVHYGKLDLLGNAVWSGTAPEISVNAIAVDDQGRLWIGGNGASEGKLIKVEADGTNAGTFTNGATITDLDFTNGRLSWTGRMIANDPTSYLINTTPDP